MDDGGQRLLDVIEDTHVLETFLRENFPNSVGLEDSTRFDNASSSTDSGLVTSAGFDSFVFDGQLVDPIRGSAPPHSSHLSHPVSPHVLQQVLHPPAASSALSGPSPHQLHPHQLHPHQHQQHHLTPSGLLHSHHVPQGTTHHGVPSHPQQPSQQSHVTMASPVGGGVLDVDCIGRGREACGGTSVGSGTTAAARNDSDHTLQQLLAAAPQLGGGSQPILQLHPQSHQHTLHQPHSQLQPLSSPAHQHLASQSHPGHHGAPTSAVLPSSIAPLPPNPSVLLQHQQQQQQHRLQQPRQSPSSRPQPSPVPSPKTSHQQPSHDPSQGTVDLVPGLLPIGIPLTPTSASCGTSTLAAAQQSPALSLPEGSRSKTTVVVASSAPPPATVIVSGVPTPGVASSGSRVQVVGGPSPNQVLGSTTQLLAPSSQLLSGTPIAPPGGQAAQVISGSSILAPGAQVLAPNILPGGQVLSSMPSGQVFPGGQLLPNPQVLTNHLMTNSHVISTVGAFSSPTAAPLYVTPSPLPSHIQQPPLPPIAHNPLGTVPHSGVATSTMTLLASPPATASPAFTVPSKSPVSALPRTSPGPSYPATPSPHHNATPSPASYPSRSPAPSPHSHVSSLRSPAPNPSPAVTPTAVTCTSQSTQTVISSSAAPGPVATPLVSGMVGNMGMMQGLVPHLPITQVGGSNGVMSMQVTAGLKQVVPGAPLIQIVSSQNNPSRQTVALPHPKPIQPKQPQLLPKPPPQGGVRQPTPPPAGKTLLGSRPAPSNNHQPIVLGTGGGQQPTVITGQHGIGGIVLNSSLLQTGLQQPLLIPQPNGVQLLVRPAGHPSGAAGQTLLVPMPNQSQAVTSMGKVPPPQTLVIPGSGQAPALVLNHGMTLGGTNMLSSPQGARAPQPIIKFVAPQASLQLQQINTPGGPMLVAVPVGQTALNLPGVFAAPTSSVRTLAPQVAPGTLQIGSSLAPVSLNPLQISGGGLQVSSSSQPLHLSGSLPSSLSSVITTPTPHARSSAEDVVTGGLAPTPPSHISVQATPAPASTVQPSSQHLVAPITPEVNKNNAKKKSKKKKKEKDSKEGKGKGVSINLNELLKETGIFDENEFSGLGIEDSPEVVSHHSLPQAAVLPASTPAQAVNCKVSSGSSHLVLNTSLSQPMPAISVGQNHHVVSTSPLTLAATTTASPVVPITTIPTSMCFTLDVHGKLVLGSGDAAKSHITAIAGSLPSQGAPLQVVSPSSVNLNSGGTYVIGNNEGISVPVSRGPVTGVPPVGHLVALHPTTGSQIEVTPSPNVMKIDNLHPQFVTSKGTSPSNQCELLKPSSASTLIQSGPDKPPHSSSLPMSASATVTPSLITSILNNPASSVAGGNADPSAISVHLTGSEKLNIVSAEGKSLSDLSSNGLIGSHSSQVPLNNSTVIVSSNYANSFFPSSIINGKSVGINTQPVVDTGTTVAITTVTASTQAHFVTCNTLNTSKGNMSTIPVSMHLVEGASKSVGYTSTSFLGAGVKSNIVEAARVKKSKKKKKDKEVEANCGSAPFITSAYHSSGQDKSPKNGPVVSTHAMALSSPVLLSNGGITTSSSSSPIASATPSATGKGEASVGILSPKGEAGGGLVSSISTGHSTQSSQHQHLPLQVFSHVVSSTATTITSSNGNNSSSSLPAVPSSSSSNFIANCLNNSITNVITVTSNSIVSTLSNSNSSTNVTTVSCLSSNPNAGVARMSIPIGTTSHNPNFNSTPGFVVQPGQQVKQLLLSPHNQEALKKVHSQIQDLQNKKGLLGEQDKSLQQRLIVEYRKIMATGTPVPVSHSSIIQPLHSITATQHNPIKYSHSIGHKKIVVTQNPRKVFSQPHLQIKKHCSEAAIKHSAESKSKECESVSSSSAAVSSVSSSAITFSSQPVTISESGYVTAITATTPATTLICPTPSSSNVPFTGLPAVPQPRVSPARVSEGSKVPEKEVVRSNASNVTTTVTTTPCSINGSVNHGFSCPTVASMPVIITSTKPSSLPTSTVGGTIFSHRGGATQGVGSTNLSRSCPIPLSPTPMSVHTQTPPLPAQQQQQHPSSSCAGEMLPPPHTTIGVTPIAIVTSVNQAGSISYTTSLPPPSAPPPPQQHQQQPPPTPALPTMRSSFSIPRTRDQLFEHQLNTDQNGALNPDYRTPFKNKTDACKRLIRYHVYNDSSPSPSDLLEGDSQFELQSDSLIKKFSAMQYKYKSLLLRESMRRHPSSETAMLYRLFVQEEKNYLEREKMDVVNGKDLCLPPAPPHWVGAASPPVESPFPWEDDWADEKAYFVTQNDMEPPEKEEGREILDAVSESMVALSAEPPPPPAFGADGGETDWPPEDEDEDEEEEGQDEGRLQILMDEEETDESRSQGASETIREDEDDGATAQSVYSYEGRETTSPRASARDRTSLTVGFSPPLNTAPNGGHIPPLFSSGGYFSEGKGMDEKTNAIRSHPSRNARHPIEGSHERDNREEFCDKYNNAKISRGDWSEGSGESNRTKGRTNCDYSIPTEKSKAEVVPPYGANNSYIECGHESTKENGVDVAGIRDLKRVAGISLSPEYVGSAPTQVDPVDDGLHSSRQEMQPKFQSHGRSCSNSSLETVVPPPDTSNYYYYYNKGRMGSGSKVTDEGNFESGGEVGVMYNREDEKYNRHHDRKYRMDKDRRRHDKGRDKNREERSSRKLKIKLRPEDPKGVVPPLRIRSDGSLKLTLKKQEGSSGYYRVGEEKQRPPGREYRVELSEEDESVGDESDGSFSLRPPAKRGNSDLPPPGSESDRQLRGFSVVLENCLEGESKVYNTKVFEEGESRPSGGSYKRSKRLKSHHHHHHHHHHNHKIEFDSTTTTIGSALERRENNVAGITHVSPSTWSSKQENLLPHPPSALFAHHQYTFNAAGLPTPPQTPLPPHHQSVCVPPHGQKVSHQSSRNSHRFS